MPLSYAAVLGGCCTLIGTSTNLLVNDMAAVAGQPKFGIFEITPVGLAVALSGGALSAAIQRPARRDGDSEPDPTHARPATRAWPGGRSDRPQRSCRPGPSAGWGARLARGVPRRDRARARTTSRRLPRRRSPARCCWSLLRIITADEAYSGLRADVLMLIAGMLVLGIALSVTGVAGSATEALIARSDGLSPLAALIIIYGVTLFATELLSNATVAVLFTPMAVSLAEALDVSPRPFLVAVMMAGSAAFATPFGYQTNVLVYQIGGYSYMDFVSSDCRSTSSPGRRRWSRFRMFFPF